MSQHLPLDSLLLSGATGFGSNSLPLSLPRYAEAIHRLRTMLDVPGPHGSLSSFGPLVREMQSLQRVRLGDGRIITTDLPDWARQLQAPDTNVRAEVIHRLESLDAALNPPNHAGWQPSELKQLDSVLGDERFHPHLNPIQGAEQWLHEQLSRLLRLLPHPASLGPPSVNRVEIVIMAVIFLVLVAGAAVLIARATIARTAATAAMPGSEEDAVTPDLARDLAQRNERAGNYREAVRYLFLATLLGLRDAGLLQLRPGDTNREYLRSLAQSLQEPARHQALADLVDEFDYVWYGHRPVTAQDYERCRILADRILSAGRAA